MKLSPRDAEAYFTRPDPGKAGLLIYGADGMRVALKRQLVLKALLGPNAEEDMRLTRLAGGDIRKDPAEVLDALKATGFFPGARGVLIEDAADAAAPAITAALDDWVPGDAYLVVTAGSLKPASKLRKLFETQNRAYAAAIYDDPPSRAEIERVLGQAGLTGLSGEAMGALSGLAATLGPGDFAQTVEKIALYKRGDAEPLTVDEIDLLAPQSTEAGLDTILNAVADGNGAAIGPLMRRLQSQGVQPVTLCIGATRHFRTLYTAAADPGGASAGVGRLRPPVYGPRRDKIVRQAQNWGADRLQRALTELTDTDLQLRSGGQSAPAMALVERTLIRLAMLSRSH